MTNENTNTSGSIKIMTLLKTLSNEDTFTAKELTENANVSPGSVTGLLAKLKQKSLIKEVGRNGIHSLYSICGDLEEYSTRNGGSVGSYEGRHITGHSRRQRMINSLFALIEEMEKIKGDLSDFSTKELLHEIEKRTNK